MKLRISAWAPPARPQWHMSACHISLGRSAAKRTWADFGRFLGSGTTRPAATRRLQIVDVDTSTP